MARKIKFKIKSDLDKLRVLSILSGRNLSESELGALFALCEFSSGNSLTTTPEITKQMVGFSGLSQSTFNTCVFRLSEKGAIKKEGKTIMLHPLYWNIQKTDELYVSFFNESLQADQSPETH